MQSLCYNVAKASQYSCSYLTLRVAAEPSGHEKPKSWFLLGETAQLSWIT